MRNLFSLIDRFRKDERGNIAVIFLIALVPLIASSELPSTIRW
jgi:Flp pilus assembly protein TadG